MSDMGLIKTNKCSQCFLNSWDSELRYVRRDVNYVAWEWWKECTNRAWFLGEKFKINWQKCFFPLLRIATLLWPCSVSFNCVSVYVVICLSTCFSKEIWNGCWLSYGNFDQKHSKCNIIVGVLLKGCGLPFLIKSMTLVSFSNKCVNSSETKRR